MPTMWGYGSEPRGSFGPNDAPAGFRGIQADAPDIEGVRSTLSHELQHAIQRKENFAGGGNPGLFTEPDLNEMGRAAVEGRSTPSAFEQYRRLAGEAEARLTQTRLPLTAAERRARPAIPRI